MSLLTGPGIDRSQHTPRVGGSRGSDGAGETPAPDWLLAKRRSLRWIAAILLPGVVLSGCGASSNTRSSSAATTVPVPRADRALVGQCFLRDGPRAAQIGASCDGYRNGRPKTLQIAAVTGAVDENGSPRCSGGTTGYEKGGTGVFLCGQIPDSSGGQSAPSGLAVANGACTNITGIMSFSGSATEGDVVDCSDPHAVGRIHSTDTSSCGTGYVDPQTGDALDVVRVDGETVCVEQGPVDIPSGGR